MAKIIVVILLMVMIMVEPPKSVKAVLSDEDLISMECLNVPASLFVNTLKNSMDGVVKVASIIAEFAGVFGDFRVSNAISDCLDLLQLSSDELGWTLYASQYGKGKRNGTGDLASDLKTWLSASLINQETCLDGFDGTSSIVKALVSGSINQVSSLVQQVLHMVHQAPRRPTPSRTKGARPGSGGRRLMASDNDASVFPSWIRSAERKLLQSTKGLRPNVTVALDGSGNFTKIMDAIAAAPSHSTNRFVIYVKKGVYDEIVEIKRKKTYIMIYGDGIDVTVITGNRSVVDGYTTYRSATFAVTGARFIARDITFQNTAGPEKHQAVAFRSDSDLSALYRCAFRGYQDTLYAHANRQFFRECTITGTVDFIFGDAVAIFQNCLIQSRKGLSNQKNTITAQGRKDPAENTGFSLQFCNITGDSSLNTAITNTTTTSNTTTTYTYLGRPWKAYSRTIIMQSYISGVIRPVGWLEWNGDLHLDTLFYAEYMNYGPGASLSARVKWPGYNIFNSSAQALNYTVAQFIKGDMWLPTTGVRFASGLSAL